jgi:outer membrane protein assembly factor BamB
MKKMTIMALSRIHLIIISATIALLLNACSQQTSLGSQLLGDKTSRAIALTPLKKIENPIPTHKNWQVKTGRGMGENKIHPFFTDKIIFVASVHSVSAWNKDNGTLIWKRAFGEAITAGINGDLDSNSDQIVIGSNKGNAIALDVKTGKIRWVERLSSEILAVSPSKNGFIALRTVDGKIHGLSSQTGEIIWQRSQRTPKLSHFGASVPVIIDDNVISGFDNGKLVAYQLSTGKPQWEVTLAVPKGLTELDQIIDIDGKITVIDNALFASSLNGNATGIQGKTGNPVWLRPFSTPSGLSASTKTILARDNQGNIWKFDPQTGNPIWKMDDLKLRQPTLPVIINSELAITADKQGKIHWINTKTGKVVARDTADKTGYAVAPVINKKAIYLIGKSGLLTKFSQ